MPVIINGSTRYVNGIARLGPYKVDASTVEPSSTLLSKFLESHKELETYRYFVDSVYHATQISWSVHRNGKTVKVDGQTLSIAAVAAAARYHAKVELDDSPTTRARLAKSRKVITDKVESGTSVYGLSTGFGGSGEVPIQNRSFALLTSTYIADTRTDQPLLLGHALLQHQHIGVLPTSTQPLDVLPLLDPNSSTAMPESWVRSVISPSYTSSIDVF
jgi:phenylalanine ammonia-lyase